LSDYFGDAMKRLRGGVTGEEGERPAPAERPEAPGDLKVPEDTDIQPGAIRVSQPRAPKVPPEDYTPDGTYVPRSGGRRGWFENAAVLANERPNNYRFHEGIDSEAFNTTILNTIEPSNRRGSARALVRLPVRFALEGMEEREVGFSADLSMTGARIRSRMAMTPEQAIVLTLYGEDVDPDQGAPLLEVAGSVVWSRQVPGRQSSARYYQGLRFGELNVAQKQRLADIVSGGKPLLEEGPAAPTTEP